MNEPKSANDIFCGVERRCRRSGIDRGYVPLYAYPALECPLVLLFGSFPHFLGGVKEHTLYIGTCEEVQAVWPDLKWCFYIDACEQHAKRHRRNAGCHLRE